MGEVLAEVEIAAPAAEVWEAYLDPAGWPLWVDGFVAVTSTTTYPEVGGTLQWRSTPAGRGDVTERVLAHEPRRLHRIVYTDPGSNGEIETRFEMVPGAGAERRTKVSVDHSYALEGGGALKPIVDRLFVRSQMQRSLERTLADFRRVVENRSGGDAPTPFVTLL